MSNLYGTSINKLNINLDTYNALARLGFNSVGDLVDVIQNNGIGAVASISGVNINEVVRELRKYGVVL